MYMYVYIHINVVYIRMNVVYTILHEGICMYTFI